MVDKKSGRPVAHKVFDGADEYSAELAAAMLTADHPYIVQPICILPSKGLPGIVFEFVEGLPSSKYVLEPSVGYEDVQRMAAQLFDAMTYLHYQGYIHGDLKPDNVMMTPEGNIKVIDLGFALRIPYTKGNRGTATTMAPELVKAVPGPIAESTDWWAYGSTVAMWNSLIITREKSGRYVPLLLNKSAEHLDKMFKFGVCTVEFPTELKQFLAMFLQAEVEKRRFNKLAEIDFVKRSDYLQNMFV
jgi:serine/threonine protein kinase